KPAAPSGGPIGVDLGIATTAALSSGETLNAPKITPRQREREKRLRQGISRRVKGSANRRKAMAALRALKALHRRRRDDWQHKFTHRLAKNHSLVVLEDLRVKNMTRSAKGTIEEPGKNVRQKAGLNRSLLELAP